MAINLLNGSFERPGVGFSSFGWLGGRRTVDPTGTGGYVAEIVGPAGIMHQTISVAEAKKIVDLAKGRLTITFTLVSPAGNSGLIVSFGGKVFDAENYRVPLNPGKVEIPFEDYRFSRQGDRTISFQVKRVSGRALLDNVQITYSPLGPDDGGVVEPTPTLNPALLLPPGSLGRFPAVFPYSTPTPRPTGSLDVHSLRVSVNPPIIYVAPASAGSSQSVGAGRVAVRVEMFKTDGTRMTPGEFAQREAKVTFEFLGDDTAWSLFQEDDTGNNRSLQGTRLDLEDYLLGASGDEARQLYFVPNQVKDAEVRLKVHVELDMPRVGQTPDPSTGQTPDLPQPLELSTIVPISVRVARGVPAKGAREVQALEPPGRSNRIFTER